MTEEIEYFNNRRLDKTYLSKSFPEASEGGRKMRFLMKAFDPPESHCVAQVKREWVLHVSHGQKYEIKALFYEDSREIRSLTIQRFTIKSGKPHKHSYTFGAQQVARIYDVLRAVRYFDLSDEEKQRIDDRSLDELLVTVDDRTYAKRVSIRSCGLSSGSIRASHWHKCSVSKPARPTRPTFCVSPG